MRNKIEAALKPLGLKMYYGMGPKIDKDNYADMIIFNQREISVENLGESYVLKPAYRVIIIKENYIEDQLVFDVLEALKDIPGLRIMNEIPKYDYLPIGDTDRYVETLTLYYSATVKRFG